MTDREPIELDELLRIATDTASYGPYSDLIGDLVIAIDRLRAPKLVDHTIDDLYEQHQQICEQNAKIIEIGLGNQGILHAVAEEYRHELELERAEQEAGDVEPIIATPPTGVNAHIFQADGAVHVIENVDVVHVILDNGTVPFAYEAEEDGERRKPGYYDDAGEFHAFDDRRASRRGW